MKQKLSKAYFISKIFAMGFVLGMLTAPYGLYARSDGFLIKTYENVLRSEGSELPDVEAEEYGNANESTDKEGFFSDHGFELAPKPRIKPKRG